MALFDDASLVTTPNGYKAGTLYSIKPTSGAGDMTVVRATTATRVNSAGLIESVANNVPRLDYSNGTCPSLLVEPQRTNSILYSEQFNNAAWALSSATISTNATTAPDGTLTADKFIATATTAVHFFQQSSISSSYVFSIYAKAGEENVFSMWIANTSKRAEFNLTTGTIPLSTVANSSIVNVGNGWYRCSVYDSSPTTTYRIYGRTGSSYLGNGVDGIFFWGAQIEAGTYATSYIPTTSAAVTRNADVISKTGISGLIGQTEGVLFADFVINGRTNNTNILNSEKNTVCSFFFVSKTNGNMDCGLYASAVAKARITAGSVAVNQRAKVAYAYKSGNSALYINGVQVGTSADTYTLPSTLDDIFLNDITTYFSYQESVSYNQVILFPTRLTNAELAQLTT